jgi:hypothetical protein
MQKQKQLKSLKDNAKFKIELRNRSSTWQVIQKKKGKITCNSTNGSTRVFDGGKLVYPV